MAWRQPPRAGPGREAAAARAGGDPAQHATPDGQAPVLGHVRPARAPAPRGRRRRGRRSSCGPTGPAPRASRSTPRRATSISRSRSARRLLDPAAEPGAARDVRLGRLRPARVPSPSRATSPRRFPRPRSVVLPECGHVPQVELPEAANGLVRDFIEQAATSPAARAAAMLRRAGRRISRNELWGRTQVENGNGQPRSRRLRTAQSLTGPRLCPCRWRRASQRAHRAAEDSQSQNGGDPGAAAGLRRPPDAHCWARSRSRSCRESRTASAPTSTTATRTTSARTCRSPGCSRASGSAARCADMDRIPESKPVLLVGNHSGGNITPDTIVFTLAFNTYFGVERPLPPARPQPGPRLALRPVPAPLRHRRRLARERPQGARRRRRGARLPGRRLGGPPPELGGEQGRLRTAARASSGWRSTRASRSSRWSRSGARRPRSSSATGSGSRKALGLDRLLRLKVLPISLALPWVINVGDFLGHLPLPAKITRPGAGSDRPGEDASAGTPTMTRSTSR